MMNGIHRVREEFHNRVLIARSIETILVSLRFERLWGHSSEEQKGGVEKYIHASDKKGILKWMEDHPSIDIGEKSLRELYPIAKKLRIKNYSRLQRDDLIVEIKKAEAASVTQQGAHAQSDPKKDHSDVSSPNLLQGEGRSLTGS